MSAVLVIGCGSLAGHDLDPAASGQMRRINDVALGKDAKNKNGDPVEPEKKTSKK